MQESAVAVNASNFTAITGQLLIDQVKERYTYATAVGDRIFRREQITNRNLGPQVVPWLSDAIDDGKNISQGEEYP